jgi:hypothetical protein
MGQAVQKLAAVFTVECQVAGLVLDIISGEIIVAG